ncbi:VRR-NUC domain-containing protein [Rhodanobacter sp. FW106-PBR-R2A-1-13]|uniref:VRR-NUC domain-containing protein n=1 Tax=Rhodanobacter sp. FW106-PBR-R2A-1-13 TaxID=3454845 RepID=UPI0034E3B022
MTERMDVATYRAILAGNSGTGSDAAPAPARPTVKRAEPEYEEQVRFFGLVALLLQIHADRAEQLEDVWATSSGGRRDARTAGKLKAAGQRPGVPDIEAPVPMGGFHGLFIELKPLDSGRASREQKARLERLHRRGYRTAVCHGWLAAGRVLCAYLALPWPDNVEARVEAHLAFERQLRRRARQAARRAQRQVSAPPRRSAQL